MGLRKIGMVGLVLLLVSFLGCAATWWLPFEKPDGVFGRFNFLQILLLVGANCLFVTSLVFVLTRHSHRRRVGFRIVVVWLGIAVPIGIWEAAAYLLPVERVKNPWYLNAEPHEDGLPYRRPAYIQWKGRSPGDCTYGFDLTASNVEFVTDKNGFRNREDLARADVVFLGDSYTEGMNVNGNETFVDIVRQQTGLVVANLGRSGYSPGPELRVLKHYCLDLKPGIVVWQLCEGNDLEDSVTYLAWLQSGRRRFYEEGERHRETALDTWKRRSPTFQLFTAFRPWPYEGVFRRSDGTQVSVRFFRPLQPAYHCPQNHPGWDVIDDAIRTGHTLLEQHGIRLVIVLAPLKLRVLDQAVTMDDIDRSRLFVHWTASPEQTWSTYLERLCRELEIRLVNPTGVLRKASSAGLLPYLVNDTHFSPEGHRIVADEILRACDAVRSE